MRDERITIRLNEQEHILLKSISIRENKTESEVVRTALQRYLSELLANQNCYELANSLGIIGVAGNLPSDLSTNKEYFAGFGE